MTPQEIIDGQVLLVDKPLEWTSFQAVAKIRYTLQKLTGKKKLKVGHAGTLDPLATGLLIICVGKKTKDISDFMGMEKEYVAGVKLGATTPSYDLESAIDATFPTEHITLEAIQETLESFKGDIAQIPPVFSAIKKDGVRAYEKARAGEQVQMEPRMVNIREIEVLRFEVDVLELRIVCSKGTYIRSLAHDIGKALNSGGHLVALRRTKIGPYAPENGKGPNEWAQHFQDVVVQ